MRNSILAVLPSSSLSCVGSCSPGTCTRMRSVLWRWISGSTVPSSLMRRSTIWIDCSMARRVRPVIAACGVGIQLKPPPASLTSKDRWTLEPSRPRGGGDTPRSLASAVGTPAGSAMRASTASPRTRTPPVKRIFASRRARRASSRMDSSRSFLTALASISSSRYEPPCRSSPSTRRRCAQAGQPLTVASGKKFGTAQRHTTRAVRMMPSAFHRVKYNIKLIRQIGGRPASICVDRHAARRHARTTAKRSARRFLILGDVSLFFRRLALRADGRDHLPHLADTDAVGDLELDLVVVDDLGHFADQAALGDDGVAATDVLDQVGMLFDLLLLRSQNQEIHDHEDDG